MINYYLIIICFLRVCRCLLLLHLFIFIDNLPIYTIFIDNIILLLFLLKETKMTKNLMNISRNRKSAYNSKVLAILLSYWDIRL